MNKRNTPSSPQRAKATAFSVAQTIKFARGARSQKDFAGELGVTQSLLSKYERGSVSPPNKVVEHCVDALRQAAPIAAAPEASELAQRITSDFASPSAANLRMALAMMLDAVKI